MTGSRLSTTPQLTVLNVTTDLLSLTNYQTNNGGILIVRWDKGSGKYTREYLATSAFEKWDGTVRGVKPMGMCLPG